MRADPTVPIVQDLVLVGGGHAHALFLARWAMRPVPGVRVTLVSPEPMTPYTGMLPGFVAGHYRLDDVEIDLDRLARRAGADLVLDRAVGLDRAARRVLLSDPARAALAYDVVSFDVGSHTEPPAADGSVAPSRPLSWFRSAFEPFLERVRAGEPDLCVAVVGAGVGGSELALALAHRVSVERPDGVAPPGVALLDRSEGLSSVPAPLRRRLTGALARFGVRHETGFDAVETAGGRIRAADGRVVDAAFAVVATGSQAAPWLARTGLPLDAGGYIRVRPDLRSVDDDRVFAAGDVAAFETDPRPKAGVFAVRQAPTLFDNVRAALTGGRARAWRPQRDYLKLVSLGEQAAAAEKWGASVSGRALWRWKDRIDRAFMARVSEPPAVAQPIAPAGAALGLDAALTNGPICVGCGGKIGAPALSSALASAGSGPRRAEVEISAAADAALLRFANSELLVSVDQIRPVSGDLHRAAEIAVVHAFGDVWARGAEPVAALLTLSLAPMSPALQATTLAPLLAGADAALRAIGAARAGGHTAEAAETAIGVVALGRPTARTIGQDGARPGDALILTKPLGTGLLLAGAMRGRVSGRDVAAALDAMRAPSGDAARRFAASDVRAATDVTGFGFLGHLLNILDASNISAEIDARALPALSGALAAARAGVRSSLRAENAAALARLDAMDAAPELVELILDPQTAGGLLACAAPDAADALASEVGGVVVGRIVAPGAAGPRAMLLTR